MSKDSSSKKEVIDYKNTIITLFSGLGFFYAGQIIPVLFIVSILNLLGNDQYEITELLSNNYLALFLVLLSFTSMTVYLVYRYLLWRKESPKKLLLLEKKPEWSQIGEVAVIYGPYFLSSLFITFILSFLSIIDVNQAQDLRISTPQTVSGKFLIFLSLVILPAIGEEILFRGFLFNSIKKYSNKYASYIITSVLFGIAHLEYSNLNWIAVVDTLIFSVFLIYISQRHKSLYSAMFLHVIKNSIAFYILFIK